MLHLLVLMVNYGNGSLTVAAALDPGDIVTDAFNYTVSDGNGEDDIAVLTITIGINDAPVADNETGSVTVSHLTVSDGTRCFTW